MLELCVEYFLLGLLALALLYPYVVYPVLLHLLCARYARALEIDPAPKAPQSATVSVLLAVHNEEKVIAEKIQNFLRQDYPLERRELIVVSDGSTDDTEQIVRSINHPQVRLVVQPRTGKTAALNAAAEVASGTVYVFTDANTMFSPGTLAQLVGHFDDDRVGLVSGQATGEDGFTAENIYHRLERMLKVHESRLGVLPGADGAIYALRSELWRPLDRAIINDFYHPIAVALSGARSLFDPHATAREPSDAGRTDEFARQRRMAAQAFAILWRTWPALLRRGKLTTLWVLVSHRLLRWLHAPVLAATLLLLSYLGWSQDLRWMPFIVFSFFGFLALGLAGANRRALKPFRLCYEFELIHLAYCSGILDFLRGRTHVIWQPRAGASGRD